MLPDPPLIPKLSGVRGVKPKRLTFSRASISYLIDVAKVQIVYRQDAETVRHHVFQALIFAICSPSAMQFLSCRLGVR
jgi:hypothetical protein